MSEGRNLTLSHSTVYQVNDGVGGWDPQEAGVPGSLDKHGNPNVLTRGRGTASLSQGCAAPSRLVQVARYDGPVLPITAFDLPRFVPFAGTSMAK